MTVRRQEVLRAAGAIAALMAGLVGVPAGLVALGQGVPTRLPTPHTVSSWWGHPVTDSSLLRAVTLACWMVWLLFALAVMVEIATRWSPRGRVRWRVPGVQNLAGALVVGAVLLVPQRSTAVDATPPLAVRLAATTSLPVSAPAQPEVDGGVALAATVVDEPAPVNPVRYVVQRYDSPWRIAERRLGDGTRWREILDQRGQTLVRPAGDGVAPRARLIYPGEVLLLPADAAASGVEPCPAPEVSSTQAAAPLPPAAVSPEPPVVARPPAPSAPVAPVPAPPVATTLPPPVMHAIPDGAVGATPSHAVLDVTADRHRPHGSASAEAQTLLEAGVLSAVVLGTINRLRRRQAQYRPYGRRIRLPDGDLAATERSLRLSQQPVVVDLIERATRSLAVQLGAAHALIPSILGVVATSEDVELLLDRPAAPPPPWRSSAEGFRWRLPAADVPTVDDQVSAPLPALAPVGKAAGSDAEVLLNLEAAGLLALAGAPARAAALAHAVAAGLVGAPWAGAVNLTLIGFPADLRAIDRVRQVPTVAELMPELRETAKVMADLLAEQGCADTVAARIRGLAADGWPPTVVVCCRPLTGDERSDLVEVIRPGCGVVVVAPGGAGTAPLTIDVDPTPMLLEQLRLAVEPTLVSDTLAARLGALIEIAQDETGATLDDRPYDSVVLTAEREEPAVVRPSVLVKILGTVEVDGASEFKRPKSKELVAFLAMHPHGVGEAELDEAMWPSDGVRVVVAATRDSTVSVARTAVGGPARLLPAQVQGREKRYQLSGEVSSDWAQFCALHRRGRTEGNVSSLHQALDLVRGRPFDGVIAGRAYGWVHREGHARHIEAEVADAAELAAGLYLQEGDARGARWAARRGLVTDPYAERLWVRLMEAADRLGESQEVERIMDEMDAVLELGGDFSMLHPNTLAAYARFSRRDSGARSSALVRKLSERADSNGG